jgi:signal transduction histidine kinase
MVRAERQAAQRPTPGVRVARWDHPESGTCVLIPGTRSADKDDVDTQASPLLQRGLGRATHSRAAGRVWSSNRLLLIAYCGLATAMIGAYHLVQSEDVRNLLYEAIGASCLVAILVGVHRHRPDRRSPWFMLLAGQALWVVGDIVWSWYPAFTHRDLPYPSVADGLYLLGYPLLAVGLFLLVRTRKHGPRDGWVDAGIVVSVFGWLLWELVLYLYPGNVHVLGDYVNLVYALVDVVLVAMLARVMFAPGRRPRAFAILAAGLLFVLVADVIYARMVLVNWDWWGWNVLDNGWMIGYALLGAAALHPSMSSIGRLTDETHARMTVGRFGLLLGIVSVPSFGFFIGTALGLDMHPSVTIAVIITFIVLGSIRMMGLLRDNETQTQTLRVAQHERGMLLQQVTGAGERERIRLAAELHDGPIQHLTSLRFRLDRATARLRADDLDTAGELVDRIGDDVTDEIGVLRKIMAELRPPILSERGLGPALDDYAGSLRNETTQRIVVVADLPETLDDDTEIALYRIAQEGMINAVRHSGGSRVDVSLRRERQQIELEVRDDGSGFVPAERKDDAATHFGLIAMRERALMHGGTFRVESAPGRGTAILATIPLRRREA